MAQSSYRVRHWDYCVRPDELLHFQRTYQYEDPGVSYFEWLYIRSSNTMEIMTNFNF